VPGGDSHDPEEKKMKPEIHRKKPVEIEMMPWSGNVEDLRDVQDWVGGLLSRVVGTDLPGDHKLQVWNAQESCWLDVPIGHHIARGALGEYYPVSPEAIKKTFEFVRYGVSDKGDDDD
jgi:hypothetical protein